MTENLNEQAEIIENLTSQITATTTELAKLEAEFADFNNLMHIAASDADSSSMYSLQNRQDKLPFELEAARIRLAQLRLSLNEARLPAAQAAYDATLEPIQKQMAKHAEAERELDNARASHYAANEDGRELRRVIAEQRREKERLEICTAM